MPADYQSVFEQLQQLGYIDPAQNYKADALGLDQQTRVSMQNALVSLLGGQPEEYTLSEENSVLWPQALAEINAFQALATSPKVSEVLKRNNQTFAEFKEMLESTLKDKSHKFSARSLPEVITRYIDHPEHFITFKEGELTSSLDERSNQSILDRKEAWLAQIDAPAPLRFRSGYPSKNADLAEVQGRIGTLQGMLNDLGYNAGKIDGSLGPRSLNGLMEAAKTLNLPLPQKSENYAVSETLIAGIKNAYLAKENIRRDNSPYAMLTSVTADNVMNVANRGGRKTADGKEALETAEIASVINEANPALRMKSLNWDYKSPSDPVTLGVKGFIGEFDANKDGLLSKEELKEALKDAGNDIAARLLGAGVKADKNASTNMEVTRPTDSNAKVAKGGRTDILQ